MASPIGHALIGVGLAGCIAQIQGSAHSPLFWLGTIVASNLPDLDLIGLAFGLPFQRVHRKATHSILTLAGVLLVLYLVHDEGARLIPPEYFIPWAVALLSHPLLDVVTTGASDAASGFGVPLFWPLLSKRWAAPNPIFHSAPIRAYYSIRRLRTAILPELYWCAAFAVVLNVIGYAMGR